MQIPARHIEIQSGESRTHFRPNPVQKEEHLVASAGTLGPAYSDRRDLSGAQRALRLVSQGVKSSIHLPGAPSTTAIVGVGLPKVMKLAFNRLSRVVDGDMGTLAPAWRAILALKKEEPQHSLEELVEAYEDLYQESAKDSTKTTALYAQLSELSQIYPSVPPADMSKLYAGLYQVHAGNMNMATTALEFLLMRADDNPDLPLILLGLSFTGLYDMGTLSGEGVAKGVDVLLEMHREYPEASFAQMALSLESLIEASDGNLPLAQEILSGLLQRGEALPLR